MSFTLLSDMSPGMQRGLIRCSALVVQVDDDRHAGIANQTIAALLRHGLIHEAQDARLRHVYRPTARGLELLRAHEPRLMRPKRGYTTDPDRAMRGEGEAVDAVTLEAYALDAAERRRGEPGRREEALRRQIRTLATRLRQVALSADRAGVDDVAAQLAAIEHHVALLERARQRAA